MRRVTALPLFIAAAAALLAACGSQTASDPAAPAKVVTVTAVATPSAPTTVTVSATPTPAQQTPTAKPTRKPAARQPKAATYTMPNEVGAVLQDAQERIEGILDVPFWPLLKSHDVKDGWRFQVLDRDWKVCDQKPAAGSTFTDSTPIDFGVVKLDEHCP